MIRADDKQIRQLEKDLQTFARKALPYATRELLNRAAFETRKRAQQNIREQMVLRNKHTERSVRVEKVKGLNIGSMRAVVGSDADYMYRQEFGGAAPKEPIPTSYSAGQHRAKPRTKMPRKVNQMQQIQLKRRGKPRQTDFQRALAAAQEGDKYVFISGRTGIARGIYRVWGRERKKKQYRGVRLRMVWSIRRTRTRTPENPWLRPATDATTREMPGWYEQALRYQLQRHGVLGY